jgi:hypothetical protein
MSLKWPQWYDIHIPSFMKTGKRHSSNTKVLSQKYKRLNVGITDGRDL